MNKKIIRHLKHITSLFLSSAMLVTMQTPTLNCVQAAEVRSKQIDELLENAIQDMEDGNYIQGEAIVTLEASDVAALVQEGRYRLDRNIEVADVCEFGESEDGLKKRYIVKLTSKKYSTEELMKIALKQYYVDGISPNSQFELMEHVTYNDPYQINQWYLDSGNNQDSNVDAGINFLDQKIILQETPVIAVLDTGVNYKHPDLADNMWKNPYPEKLKGFCGYDFGSGDDDPMDTYGHGTHVAGIAAAVQDNGIGITGVSNAKIMALKITEDNSGSISQWSIIESYDYVEEALQAGVNIKAVNCSWGGNSDINGVLSKAITAVGELGALSIFAAGNDSKNWDTVQKNERTTPYDLDSPYVVIVGAVNEKDEMADFSDYSSTMVDVFAPGCNILSTYYEDTYIPKIYDSLMRKKLTSYYNSFSYDEDNILPSDQTYKNVYIASEIGIPTDYKVKSELMDEESEGYVYLEVIRNSSTSYNVNGKEEAGSIYVDVTDLNLDPNATYYVGFMIGYKANDSIAWENKQFVSERGSSRFVTKNGKTYVRIVGIQVQNEGIGYLNTCYIDDIAISIANPDTKLFGKYTYMDGTSMAAPVVSGILATFAGANPEMNSATLKKELLSFVRKVNELGDKCKTGGVIDYSKVYTRVNAVTLNKKSATLKYGKTLKLKAKVTPTTATNSKLAWKSSNTKYATVNSKGVVKVKKKGVGHTVKITVTTVDGSKKKAVCKIKIKK